MFNHIDNFICHDSLRNEAHRVLVRGKFLRHRGARDLFGYMKEHVTCKIISLVNWFI